jgi:hypothetical protein
MATDAQGRQLSDDGNYYWDGSNWQLVDTSAGTDSQQSGAASQDAQGRQLSEDGNYYWDGSQWQPVDGSQGQTQGVDGSQGDSGQNDAVDWSQFPLIEGLTKVGSVDDWIRHIGLDPNDLNVQ